MNNNFKPFPILETDRLILKQLNKDHIDSLFDYQSNKENFQLVDMPIYKTRDESMNYVKQMNAGIKDNKWIIWAICLKASHEIVGTISIWNLNAEKNTAELGYGIFPTFRHQGYMSETIQAVETYAKETMLLATLEAYTSSKNKPSRLLLVKLNYKYKKTISEEGLSGATNEMAVYFKSFE